MPVSRDSRLRTLRGQLAELRRRGSSAVFQSPLTEDEVAAFESEIGVRLPADYRSFVLEVSSGEEDTGTAPFLAPRDGLTLLSGGRPGAAFRGDESDGGADVGDDGVLPLMDHGDAEYDCLVLAGPHAGEMWTYGEGGRTPTYARRKRTARPLKFLDWVERHVRDVLSDAPPAVDAQSTDIRLIGLGLTAVPSAVLIASGVEILSVSSNEIAVLPHEIGELAALDTLAVSHNALTELPSTIGRLSRLRELSAGHNQLRRLPDSVTELASLERLMVAGNTLTTLPAGLGALKQLRELQLADNELTNLPDDLDELPALRTLTLTGNPLRQLPAWIARTALHELDLSGLPDLDLEQALTVLADLPSLQTLELGPSSAGVPTALAGLRQIRWLKLIGLSLHDVPDQVLSLESLETLSLDQNQLTSVPDAVLQMPGLTSLVLFSNPITRDELARLRERYPRVEIDA
jgi:Leucine-rich repeat (LRR) protein